MYGTQWLTAVAALKGVAVSVTGVIQFHIHGIANKLTIQDSFTCPNMIYEAKLKVKVDLQVFLFIIKHQSNFRLQRVLRTQLSLMPLPLYRLVFAPR